MKRLEFNVPNGARIGSEIDVLLLGAFTGREPADVQAHISEMAARGVTAPAETPLFYRVMTCLLTQQSQAEAAGRDSYPEVEFVLFSSGGVQYVTVGNDQFDLDLESRGLGEKSKNICQKIVAETAWPLSDVLDHWDRLELELAHGGVALQRGSVGQLLSPNRLAEYVSCGASFPHDRTMLFSGTIPFAEHLDSHVRDFSAALIDPVLGREIRHDFQISVVTAKAAA